MERAALELDQIVFAYKEDQVLKNISLAIPPGQLTAICGPNGAGKSTLLKVILNLIKPVSGSVKILGHPFFKVRNKISYVPQKETIDWDFPISVQEVVLMGAYSRLSFFKSPSVSDLKECNEILNLLDLTDLRNRQINNLSGGQKQRIFLARALLQKAEVYFLDEPFSGIDAASEQMILKLLKEMAAQGKSVFVVHHDLKKIKEHFDYAILINKECMGWGPIPQVFTTEMLIKTYGDSTHLLEVIKL